MAALTLIANPGSASRKYALYQDDRKLASLHFEYTANKVVGTLIQGKERREFDSSVTHISQVGTKLRELFADHGLLADDQHITTIGLRVVAPGAYFLQHRELHSEAVAELKKLLPRAPLHIQATLAELDILQQYFAEATFWGLSDTAFHITKPEQAWNYGLNIHDADELEIKRYGYHGLSVSAAVHHLDTQRKLVDKLLVCHLGSGVSVTAVAKGHSFDTTMGYSPLEGTIMSTRVGSIDYMAVRALQEAKGFDQATLDAYLQSHSGLAGLAGSGDVRELLQREADGDHFAALALGTYCFTIQKAIGQMAGALGGADALVFTGTIGERSTPIRARLLSKLFYLGFDIDSAANTACTIPSRLTHISKLTSPKPIYVLPTDEAAEMARQIKAIS